MQQPHPIYRGPEYNLTLFLDIECHSGLYVVIHYRGSHCTAAANITEAAAVKLHCLRPLRPSSSRSFSWTPPLFFGLEDGSAVRESAVGTAAVAAAAAAMLTLLAHTNTLIRRPPFQKFLLKEQTLLLL